MAAGKMRPATYQGGAMLLARRMLAPVLCLCLVQCLCADDWAGAVTREVFSANRSYFVRISPGESLGETVGFAGAKLGKHAVAEFFHVQADRGYRLERKIELLNPIAPVDFFVSNAGDLITLDNWHNVGYGRVLSLYRPDGKLVKAYKLAELFPKSQLDSFPHSISSIRWHKGPTYIHEDQKIFYMGYREAPDYRELILKLGDGSVGICANSPKYRCRNVS
jgi:hypothetical protein